MKFLLQIFIPLLTWFTPINAGQTYPGGGHQYEFLDNWRATAPTEYMKVVKVTKLVSKAVTFDDFLTIGGKVKKAGDQSSLYTSFSDIDNTNIPTRYLKDEQRFNNLAKDPDQGNLIFAKTRKEAMSGIEGENQGIFSNIERGPKRIEFYDSNRVPWDVKTPRGGEYFNANQSGSSIKRELLNSKTIDGIVHPPGKFIDPVTGQIKFKKVLLDCTYLNDNELQSLRNWLKNQSGLSQEELNRIVEININLLK